MTERPEPMTPPGRIAFLLSGSGSTLANLFERIDAGDVRAEVVAAAADRPGATGLALASERDIPTTTIDRRHHSRAELAEALATFLAPHRPDWIVLGGFMSMFPLPASWAGITLNVHPSLLPAFGGKGMYGHHVHEAVLARGCRVSGCTVHLVTEVVDGGPILDQATVRVEPDDTPDTLAARVQAAERELYPRVLADLIDGRIRIEDGRVTRPANDA